MAEHLAEDEAQGRGFDRGLFRRLFSLALPYRGYAGGALVVLFLESVAQLAGPLLTGAAIDLVFSGKPGPPEGSTRPPASPSQRTISIRMPTSSHVGSMGIRLIARPDARRAVNSNAAACSRCTPAERSGGVRVTTSSTPGRR